MNTTPALVTPGELKPGTFLDDRFTIVEMMNRGGMSCVYRAVDLEVGRAIAIKVPLLKFESEPVTFERFRREEEMLQLLDHPYILKALPVPDKSRPYLVMEILDGVPLNRKLAESGPLTDVEAARIAGQVCEALEYLRANGIVHRDLKPENIMLCRDGTIRLFDFGIAKAEHLRRLTFAGLVPGVGTPDYIAPERVFGKRGDHRSDIYSLGAILYEMVAGRPPFEGDSPFVVMNSRTTGDPTAPRSVRPDISHQMEEVILHAMEREPSQRYESAAEMKADLDDLGAVPVTGRNRRLQTPRPVSGDEGPWMRKGALIALFVILAQIAGFGALFWYFSAHHR